MNEIHRRAFDAELEFRGEDADGRPVVAGRIVPIGVETEIVEPGPDGELHSYRERFLPNCSLNVRQQGARLGHFKWVQLKLDHSDTIEHRIGYATVVEERDDGVYATFGLLRHAGLDKVQSMLRESHTGLSVEFSERVPARVDGDLLSRVSINLHGVAATPLPAYAGAVITSVRSAEVVDDGTPRLDAAIALLAELRATATA